MGRKSQLRIDSSREANSASLRASMDQPIVTAKLHLTSALREPTDAEVAAGGELLARLAAEADALGESPLAAPLHHAMGRIWVERLGDPQSAAACFQNAFLLDPKYRPNLEASRRLFAAEGQWERALAVHQHEESLLIDPAARAESLRAQARILAAELHRPDEADARVQKALALSPEHPALLRLSIEAAERAGDKLGCARLLLRSASSIKDDVQRGLMLRRAVLLFEELHLQAMSQAPSASRPFGEGTNTSPGVTELERLHEEALRRLAGACPGDPIASLVVAQRARATHSWDEMLQQAHEEAERRGAASDHLLAAQIAAFKLSRTQDALTEIRAGLAASPRDASLRALELELVRTQAPDELPAVLAAAVASASGPGEKAGLLLLAAAHAQTPLEREDLLTEALAENPGDAAAIALHARAVAERDAQAAAERYAAMAEVLEEESPHEAADQLAEAALCYERAAMREAALGLARRALVLQPSHPAALRVLGRELPFLGGQLELAALLEELANGAPAWQAAELLARAAAILSDLPAAAEVAGEAVEGETQISEVPPMQRALELAQRSAELAQGLASPRGAESWTMLALRAGDVASLGRSLEARSAAAEPAEAIELLLEAAELARLLNHEPQALALLLRATEIDPESASVRRARLLVPSLPLAERVELLGEEAQRADPPRAAALQAERAALLEAAGQLDEAMHACALALAAGGAEAALLRRLARIQLYRNDLPSALAALEHTAQELPAGRERAAVYSRAAELAEWRLGDAAKAQQLHALAISSLPEPIAQADLPWALASLAARARLLHWGGRYAEAAAAHEELARLSPLRAQKCQALRVAASLRAHRTREPGLAAALLRQLLAEEPGDLDAMAALLSLGEIDASAEGRRERAELRGKLASRCQDPRLAALLRADSAQDRFAAGERDQGVAELRRALALNPHDRIALDLVEEALRASENRQLLVDHLAFRCACEEGQARAALAVEQAELLAESGRLEQAAGSYRIALQADAGSLLVVRGARRLAEKMGDKPEVMRLFSKEASLQTEPAAAARSLIESARIAEELGERGDAIQRLGEVLERDPRSEEATQLLRTLLGEDAPRELAALLERAGTGAQDARIGALAWAQAGRIHLEELGDAQSAFIFAGRALARAAEQPEALLLRADAAERAFRFPDAADALARLVAITPAGDAALPALQLRLGRLCAVRLGDGKRALPLLVEHLHSLDVETLLALAPHAGSLPAAQSAPLYLRLLELFPSPGGSPPSAPGADDLLSWSRALARAARALGDGPTALLAARRTLALAPDDREALACLAELGADRAPDEALAAAQRLFALAPDAAALRLLIPLFQRTQQRDAVYAAVAVLAGLGLANPEETALHDAVARLPPAAELPALAQAPAVRASDDRGPLRELFESAASELARAFPTPLTGRERVKGDNPVRRVCVALARALGLAEPALYLSKSEPTLVAPVAAEAAGLLVGAEAPRRASPRTQRFLYARALAQVKSGAHALGDAPGHLSGARLAQIAAELVRLASPAADLSRLPARDESVAAALEPAIAAMTAEARARLEGAAAALLAYLARGEAQPLTAEADTLALAMRESAERAAMLLCGDPAVALAVVAQECAGGLARPELARLARFALSAEHLALRAR